MIAARQIVKLVHEITVVWVRIQVNKQFHSGDRRDNESGSGQPPGGLLFRGHAFIDCILASGRASLPKPCRKLPACLSSAGHPSARSDFVPDVPSWKLPG